MSDIRFFWNGIKEGKGRLVRCTYSDGQLLDHPAGTITIYARDYGSAGHFGPAVRAAFDVKNDSDSMTDYFETDRIRVVPTHPLYGKVVAAMAARRVHYSRT